MIDAWMNFWTEESNKMVSQTIVAPFSLLSDTVVSCADREKNVFTSPVAGPLMAPALIGATAINTAAANWLGFLMSGPAAGAAAMGMLVGDPPSTAKLAAKVKVALKATPPKKPVTAKQAAVKGNAETVPAAAPKVDDRPAGLDAPKGGKADDLKRISGVGPKLESVLHDLGIYHFEQIAGWTKKEIAWVDDYLRFKGRIERDSWIEQAKTFAKEAA